MTKCTLLGIVLVGCATLFLQSPVAAHVLVRDDTKQTAALLHITPNDSPIAGQTAHLYFDIQDQATSPVWATLTIVNQTTAAEITIPTQINDSSIMADYTFPEQGSYRLILTVTTSQTRTFTYDQHVSRATLEDAPTIALYPFAHFALIACGCLFLALLTIAINRRRAIHRYSTF